MLDVRVVFFVSAVVYSTAGSVDYYFFDDFGRYGELANAQVLLISSTFMAVAGAYLIAVARPSEDPAVAEISRGWLTWIGVAALVLLVLYFWLSIRNFGLPIGGIDRATLTSDQSTSAALARNFTVACILVWVWLAGHSRPTLAGWFPVVLGALALVAFDLLFFGDRRIVLCMLCGVAYLTLNRSRVLPWLIPAIALTLFALLLFAAVRSQPLDEWVGILTELDLYQYLTPVNLDFGGFPLIATDLLSASEPIVSEAPTYINSIAAAVPSALYANRPLAFSAWYVQTFYGDIAARGGGLASNWIMESFVNFGALGPALVGLATAAVLNRMCSARARWPRLNNAALLPSFAFLMRYDFTSFLQVFAVITLAAILIARYSAEPAARAPGTDGNSCRLAKETS
jgi:hypothetical protein